MLVALSMLGKCDLAIAQCNGNAADSENVVGDEDAAGN